MSNQLPVEVMEKALQLKNSSRGIYLALWRCGKPSSSAEVAGLVGHARAYVNMRLEQLAERGFVKVENRGKTKYFEAL